MNIFVLHSDPWVAAAHHCDKHVVKMILETAQMLSAAHHLYPTGKNLPLYKKTHVNHPCTQWCIKSLSNYQWLAKLGVALCEEYTYRYGKVHKSANLISQLYNTPANISDVGLTPMALAMPDEFKTNDPVVSYRLYYIQKKLPFCKYTRRPIPYWLPLPQDKFVQPDWTKRIYTLPVTPVLFSENVQTVVTPVQNF